MKLIEAAPENHEIRKYVDRYQFFEINEPSSFQAIPNGKIDSYSILSGGFELLDTLNENFYEAPQSGFLPATNHISHFRVKKKLVCLNIKMNLHVLGLPAFRNFNQDYKKISLLSLLKEFHVDKIDHSYLLKSETIDVSYLERSIIPIFDSKKEDKFVNHVLLEIDHADDFVVAQLAERLSMSSKTLERAIKKYFNLTPKELWNILRFEKTTTHLKNSEARKLQDALSFGYYDQSHFFKECKKITGTPPKELLARMKLPTNDLFF